MFGTVSYVKKVQLSNMFALFPLFLSLLQTVPKAVPNPIACSTVAPATLHLLEPVNAAFFSSKATSWSVNIIYFRFRVDSKVQKEIYHFPI